MAEEEADDGYDSPPEEEEEEEKEAVWPLVGALAYVSSGLTSSPTDLDGADAAALMTDGRETLP